MTIRLIAQSPAAPKSQSLQSAFKADAMAHKFRQLRVACAYATVAGVRSISSSLRCDKFEKTTWIIGLDDYFTQPKALRLIRAMPGSTLRIAKSHASGRFHPKYYLLDIDKKAANRIAYIGSANASAGAITSNSELVCRVETAIATDIDQFESAWDFFLKWSISPTDGLLDDYEERFNIAKLKRDKDKTPGIKVGDILENDDAEVDPTQSRTCWIEVGSNTMLGKELEIKAEQALFFGLNEHGEDPKYFKFALSDGSVTDLRLKYQSANSMWRLQMNDSVPEVKLGLRPLVNGVLGRSTKTAVFRRLKGGRFSLEFPENASPAADSLRSSSFLSGTIGRTRHGPRGRDYGWF